MVRTGGVAFLAVAAAGCDAFSTRPAGEERSGGTDRGSRHGSSARAKNPSQAPDLERKVRSGELPPLSQRLPAEPLVIPPVESVGRYGGTWHSWLQGLGATYIFTDEVGYDFLVRWGPGLDQGHPEPREVVGRLG